VPLAFYLLFFLLFFYFSGGEAIAPPSGYMGKKDHKKVFFYFAGQGGTYKRQISKPPTPYPPVSIRDNNHNRQSQRLV